MNKIHRYLVGFEQQHLDSLHDMEMGERVGEVARVLNHHAILLGMYGHSEQAVGQSVHNLRARLAALSTDEIRAAGQRMLDLHEDARDPRNAVYIFEPMSEEEIVQSTQNGTNVLFDQEMQGSTFSPQPQDVNETVSFIDIFPQETRSLRADDIEIPTFLQEAQFDVPEKVSVIFDRFFGQFFVKDQIETLKSANSAQKREFMNNLYRHCVAKFPTKVADIEVYMQRLIQLTNGASMLEIVREEGVSHIAVGETFQHRFPGLISKAEVPLGQLLQSALEMDSSIETPQHERDLIDRVADVIASNDSEIRSGIHDLFDTDRGRVRATASTVAAGEKLSALIDEYGLELGNYCDNPKIIVANMQRLLKGVTDGNGTVNHTTLSGMLERISNPEHRQARESEVMELLGCVADELERQLA